MIEEFYSLHWGLRIPLIILVAVGGHFMIQLVQRFSEWIIDPSRSPEVTSKEIFARRHPKVATVASLIASAMTFSVYFVAVGLILNEMNVSLMAYMATASIIGLAVAFGAQGLVQDIVIGLTLVFSDAFDIGDTIEASGQIGRVDRIGLRFTKVVNFVGQSVYIPNRNILAVGRYRKGCIRAYVDIQLPEGAAEEQVVSMVDTIAHGLREQHAAIILTDPEIFGIRKSHPQGWRYLRIRFRVWPGQGSVIEITFRNRIVDAMKKIDSAYADWMVTVTYRVL